MTNKTALVVVDLQNQYTDPKGCLYSACVGEHLPAILAGIEKLREKGVRIIYAVNEATGNEFSYDTEVLKRRDPIPMAGTWEAALNAKVTVRPEDLVLSHYASSAFFGTELEQYLKDCGIKNVICCGVKTNYNVRATATDAMWYGFRAMLASDMVACDSEEVSRIHLEELTKYTAKALPLQEILSRIEVGAI